MNELFAYYLEGKLKPHVSEIYALKDYAREFACIAERRAKGKVVLMI